jgi:rhodanese-related sulfurtransferase
MKNFFLALLLLSTSSYGVENIRPDKIFMGSGIKIIDIRTQSEWIETGIVKGSIPITYYPPRGRPDVDAFIKELKKHIKPNEKFAILCRTGSRTKIAAKELEAKGLKVINLEGGIIYLNQSIHPELSMFTNETHILPTMEFLNSGIKIVDIRTKNEWRQSGILTESIPITLFPERGRPNINHFIVQLNKHIKKGEKFAFICLTGSRSGMATDYFKAQGFNVVDMIGGTEYLTTKLGVKLKAYLK